MAAGAGSASHTLDEFTKILRFHADDATKSIIEVCSLDSYCRLGKGVELTTALSAWFAGDIFGALSPDFLDFLRIQLHGTIGITDAEQMNKFIIDNTKGKIQGSFSNAALRNVPLVFVSCLYFKAVWEKPFLRSSTIKDTFYGINDNFICNMMKKCVEMNYVDDPKAQICMLPYAMASNTSDSNSPRWQAMIILPKEAGLGPLMDIFASLSSDLNLFRTVIHACQDCSKQEVELSLPRFSLKCTTPLTHPLSQMGLRVAFSPTADFSLITKSTPIFVSEIVHEIVVEVNEGINALKA